MIDPELMRQLRVLGGTYGPMGVARSAAVLTDKRALIAGLEAPTEVEQNGAIESQPEGAFRVGLTHLINQHSQENGSNTPDFILAGYLTSCLEAFDAACNARDSWYGVKHEPGR